MSFPPCNPSKGMGGAKGARSFGMGGFIYVPMSYDPARPWPVLLALHGSGQPAPSFGMVWQPSAEALGFILIAPESSTGAGGWGQGDEPRVRAALNQAAMEYNVERCRVYLGGHSAGAHVTYLFGLANSDVYAALAVLAGTMQIAEQAGVWPGQVKRKIPVDIHHGMSDSVVPFRAAEDAKKKLEGAGHTVYFTPYAGGHSSVSRTLLNEMYMNVSKHALGMP